MRTRVKRSVRCRRQTVGMGLKDRGPRPKPDARARFLRDLKATFEWRGDRPNPRWAADPTGWWADASILRRLGPTLAEPFTDQPTLVIGPQSREPSSARSSPSISGWVVELRKDPDRSADSERWLTTRTPPDHQDRNLELGLRRDLLPTTARALFVDDWIDTGGQAVAAKKLVDAAAATWCGASLSSTRWRIPGSAASST